MRLKAISEETIKEILDDAYLFAAAFFIAYLFLDTTMFEAEWARQIYYPLRLLFICVILVRIVYAASYELQEVLLAAAVCLIILIVFGRLEQEYLIDFLLLLIGAKGISFRKLIVVYEIVTVGFLIFTMLSALTGHVENLVYFQEGRRARQSFGICYPTDFSAHVFYSILGYGYLRNEKITYAETAVIAGIGIAVYYFCDTRVNTVCILLTAGVLLYHKIRVKKAEKQGYVYAMNGIWSVLLSMSTVFCAFFMCFMMLCYSPDNKILCLMDKALSGRLRLGKKGIDLFGFDPFGQYIPMQGNGSTTEDQIRYFFLDCSYINIALRYGIVLLGIVLLICCIIGFRARGEKNWIFLWIIAIFSVQCMIEHHILDLAYNPFLLALFADTASKKSVYRRRGWKWGMKRSV